MKDLGSFYLGLILNHSKFDLPVCLCLTQFTWTTLWGHRFRSSLEVYISQGLVSPWYKYFSPGNSTIALRMISLMKYAGRCGHLVRFHTTMHFRNWSDSTRTPIRPKLPWINSMGSRYDLWRFQICSYSIRKKDTPIFWISLPSTSNRKYTSWW